MARLFTNGFENNSLATEWDAVVSTPTVDATIFRSGVYALKISSLSSGAEKGVSKTFAASNNNGPFWLRFYFYLTTAPSADNVICKINDSGGSTRIYLVLTSTGALKLFDEDGQIGSASSALSTSTWYCIEMKYDLTGGAGAHIVEARIDQAAAFASASNRSITNGCTKFDLGGNCFAEANTTGIWYFDDVALNDSAAGTGQTAYPGSGKVIRLKPTAAGDANTFATQTGGTAGAANNYTRVNEVAPNDATTFNGSSVLNQEDMFDLEASGIGASDTVNLVEIHGRFRNSTADNAATIKFQAKKTSGGTISQSAGITPNTTSWNTDKTAAPKTAPLTLYTDPDGSAWTSTTVDSMQAGYKLTTGPGTGSRRIDVTNVYALVDYTPATFVTTTKTITGVARIQKSVSQTITGKADILKATLQTITGKARITATTPQTITGVARVTKTVLQTITGKAYILRKTEVLTDNFNDNSIDTAKWTTTDAGQISETSQQLQITTKLAGGYFDLLSVNFYNLTSSYVLAQIVNAGNQSLGLEAVIYAKIDDNNKVYWTIIGNVISAYKIVSGVKTAVRNDTGYNSSVHKFFRIRESSGTTYWDYSTDGVTWTNYTSTANPIDPTAVYVALQAGTYQAEASTSTVIFDDFNIQNVTTSQTITGLARITKTVLQTITGLARITASTTQTITGKARITATTTQTITGKARVEKTATQTITGKSRITQTVTQTITGLARITKSVTRTITGVARIEKSTSQTITGKARITVTTLKTITGVARITKTVTQTITGLARITASATKTITGKARITATTSQTVTGKSRITATTTRTISGLASILKSVSRTITGVARITASTAQTITGKSRITATTMRVITGLARITNTSTQTITGTARVNQTVSQTITGVSKIISGGSFEKTITGKARIVRPHWYHNSPNPWNDQTLSDWFNTVNNLWQEIDNPSWYTKTTSNWESDSDIV